MKFKLFFCIASIFIAVGCSSKPSESDVSAVLAANLAADLKAAVTIEQITTDMSGGGDEVNVKFKTQLRLKEPLFEIANFEAAAKAVGGDLVLFSEIEKKGQSLSESARNSVESEIKAMTSKPVFLTETGSIGSLGEWYGAFKAKKVVDKWLASDFKTEVAPKFTGSPRVKFPVEGISVASAPEWFTKMKTEQLVFMGKLDSLMQLEAKDEEIAKAQALADQERQAKENLMAAEQKMARRLPFSELVLRPAKLGGTLVLRIQPVQSMTVRLDVVRGLQQHSRELQLKANVRFEYGHLEGWGFKPGDSVAVSHPSFDPVMFTIQ